MLGLARANGHGLGFSFAIPNTCTYGFKAEMPTLPDPTAKKLPENNTLFPCSD